MLKACAAIAVMLIAASVFYYLVIFLPREREAGLRREALDKAMIELCLEEVYELYKHRWEDSCLERGKAPDCSLSRSVAEEYQRALDRARDLCLRKYRQR